MTGGLCQQVEPGQSVPYAWDEPNHTRKLRCELDGAHGTALREPATHTYALDEIKVPPSGHELQLDPFHVCFDTKL